MTAHNGLFVARDGDGDGTSPVGARLAVGGLVAGNGSSPLDVRAGVLADNGGPLASGTSGWTYDVRPFRAVVKMSNANGPVIVSNDGTVNVATDPAPGSNSRIDVVWVRQNHVAGDGGSEAEVEVVIGVTQGSVSSSPAVPDVPNGALELAQVTVTAGATDTSGLTFVDSAPRTVANGGILPATTTERDALTPYAGQTVYHSTADRIEYSNGSQWRSVGGGPYLFARRSELERTFSTGNIHPIGATTFDTVESSGVSGLYPIVIPENGWYSVKAFVTFSASSSGYRELWVNKNTDNGATGRIESRRFPASTSGAGGNSYVSADLHGEFFLAAGDALRFWLLHTASSTLSLLQGPQWGSIAVRKIPA